MLIIGHMMGVVNENERSIHAAHAEFRAGNAAGADVLCDGMLLRMPDNGYALHLKGLIAQQRDDLRLAQELLDRAVAAHPSVPEFHNTLGHQFVLTGRPTEAAVCFRMAIALRPDFAAAHFHLATSLLQLGEFDEGWREFEWRWRLPTASRFRRPGPTLTEAPQWPASRVLLYAEHGLGTVIQFARYAPLLARLGATVYLESPAELRTLLSSLPGVSRVLTTEDPLPAHDVQIPLLSVPRLLGTTPATIPADVPYLSVDSRRREYWRQRLKRDARMTIAIAWQGNPAFPQDRLRSVPLRSFKPILDVAGVRVVSVQHGHGLEQLASLSPDRRIESLNTEMDPSTGLADAAAILNVADLTITSDTSIAHLAGALGRPVWVALAFAADWRWMLGRSDSPWYPTMRLFRQDEPGQWDGVFARIVAALRMIVPARVPPRGS